MTVLVKAFKGIVNKALFILKYSSSALYDIHHIDIKTPNWDFGKIPFISQTKNTVYRLKSYLSEKNSFNFYDF